MLQILSLLAGWAFVLMAFNVTDGGGEREIMMALMFFIFGGMRGVQKHLKRLEDRLPPGPPPPPGWLDQVKENLWEPYQPWLRKNIEMLIGVFLLIALVATCTVLD